MAIKGWAEIKILVQPFSFLGLKDGSYASFANILDVKWVPVEVRDIGKNNFRILGYVQLRMNGAKVVADGVYGDFEFLRNFFVTKSTGEQIYDC
jgi:hypothetical protein